MKRLCLLAIVSLSGTCFGQGTLQRIQKFCEDGNQVVITQGLNSTTKVQKSFPQCTVTVYLSGTTTLAAIFSDNLSTPTPLANPFTANVDGSFGLYVSAASCYDVVNSGAGFPAPFTYSYICFGGTGGGGTVAGTPPHVAKFTGTSTVGDSSGLDPGGTPTQWPLGLNVIAGAGYLQDTVGSGGVAANQLVQFDSSGNIVTAAVSANRPKGIADIGGIAGASVPRAVWGVHACVFDGITVPNDFVAPSSTIPGDCSDVGSVKPNNVTIIGTVKTVNSGAATLANVDLLPWDTVAPGSGGGSGTVSSCATTNSNAFYSAIGTIVVCDPLATDDGNGNMTMKSAGFTDTNYAGFYYQVQGPQPPATPANSVAEYPPTSVTAYAEKRPGVVGTVGQTRVITSIGTDGGGNPIAVEAWGTAGGTSLEVQTNGVDNTSQALLNHTNGNSIYGFQVTPVNPSGGIDRFDMLTPYTSASDPTAPTLTPTNPGSTNYTYGVAGCEDPGCTRHSALVTTSTTTGNATLNNTNPIKLTAYADTLYGYRFFVICRTASAGTPNTTGVIASGAGKQFSDNGLAGDASNCATSYATNNTKLDDHCLGANPSIVNAALGVPCGVDTPPASPKALDDEGTATYGAPADSNNPFWVKVDATIACTYSWTGGMIGISCPSQSGHKMGCLFHAAPATPYTFDTLEYWGAVASGSQTGTTYRALALRESATGKIVTVGGFTTNNTSVNQVLIGKWTDNNTNSSFGYETQSGMLSQPEEFSAQNDGTNIVFKHSPDGVNYFTALSEAKGTFFTTGPDQYGVCLDANAGAALMDVDRVRETQ